MNIKLGIAPINWSNDDDPNLGKDISFEQCIKEMSAAGYIGTEIGNKYPRDPQTLMAALQPLGLEVSSAWFGTYFTETDKYEETLSRFLEHMSFMRALGAKFINVCECGYSIQQSNHPIFSAQKPIFSQQQWDLLIQGLHRIGRIAHDFGLQIVYHYHAGTGVFNKDEIDYLMRHTSPQLVSLLLDTGHAVFANVDPLYLIEQYATRIRYVHLKDIRQFVLHHTREQQLTFMDAVRAGVFTVPGDGDIDFYTIINKLKKQNYAGWMLVEAEQDPAKAPPFVYAQRAKHFIAELLEPARRVEFKDALGQELSLSL